MTRNRDTIVSRPASCSALAAASITTPFPVPAGPTSTPSARTGERRHRAVFSRVSGAPIRSATSRARSVACRPQHHARLAGEWSARRSIACSWARTASVVIRPPSSGITAGHGSSARATERLSGESSPTDCSSATARSRARLNTACSLGEPRLDPIPIGRSTSGGRARQEQPSASSGPNPCRLAVSLHHVLKIAHGLSAPSLGGPRA